MVSQAASKPRTLIKTRVGTMTPCFISASLVKVLSWTKLCKLAVKKGQAGEEQFTSTAEEKSRTFCGSVKRRRLVSGKVLSVEQWVEGVVKNISSRKKNH